MTAFDISTIGEGQIRLTSYSGERFLSATKLRMTAACSEANVSGLLCQLGRTASWASVLPKGDLGERVISEFRGVGVDVSNIVRTDEGRVALYFMEPGEYPLPARVTYDREHTPFREIAIEQMNWESMLDARLVFVTGITAALTRRTAELVAHFVEAAHGRGITIALDVNYRSKLWSPVEARAVLEPIAERADLLFCSQKDAREVFEIREEGEAACRALRDRFGVDDVVSTAQIDGVYVSSAAAGDRTFAVTRVPVIDRPGAGDAFVAGTLDGYLDGDVLGGVERGMRTASFALTHHGDLTRISTSELDTAHTTDIVR